MPETAWPMAIPNEQVAQVRAFNRDYVRRIGVLARGLLDSPWSLTEARVMYEIAHRPGVTAAELADELGIDRGYLSRILKGFAGRRLLARAAAREDGRRRHLLLTAAGRRELAPLERRSQAQVRSMLSPLDDSRRHAVLNAMSVIQGAFAQTAVRPEVLLRPHRPGDMGWVVERHGTLYFLEHGWNEEFEAVVAGITAAFIQNLDPVHERCWIAESGGRRLACVFLVRQDARTAKLRMLLVEPEARGLGLGRKLVGECLAFARSAGYRRIVLWTHANLTAARHLYEEAGFRCTAREPRHSFGHAVISETWELRLDGPAAATRRPRGTPER